MHSPEEINDGNPTCPICKKNFRTLVSLQKHEKVHYPQCDKCGENFETVKLLRTHVKEEHPKDKQYKCRVCPNSLFPTEKDYLMHICKDHGGKIIECHMCSVCGKTFRTSSGLSLHIKSKCGTEKNFICIECGKKFMSPGSLYTHLQRHKGENSFMCRFCAKLFGTSGQLKVHERIHTQQKDYICNVCGKGFCHRQSLVTHISLHTGIKPYQCEGCGKSFSCVGNLLKHRRSHAESCGSVPMTSHRVQNPSTKIKVKINTPDSTKLKRARMKDELEKKFAKLNVEQEFKGNISGKEEKMDGEMERGYLLDGFGNNEKFFDANSEVDIMGVTQKTEVSKGIVSEDIQELNVTKTNSGSEITSTFLNTDSDVHKVMEKKIGGSPDYKQDDNSDIIEEIVPKMTSKRKKARNIEDAMGIYIKERNHEGEVAVCKYCRKAFSNLRGLYKHEQDHENNTGDDKSKKLPFKCSCCKMRFETRDKVKEHQERVHIDELVCHECGDKIFSNVDSLKSHQQILHKGIPRRGYVYICDKCGKCYKQKALLRTHVNTNCGTISRFQCTVCQKKFSTPHTQKAHMRVHNSEKEMSCRFCKKGFHWKGQLKVHERSHTGIGRL
ncbi:hypothetical protein JTB14_001329 [Gonioctena quinquepunctata]|nr:hypothetical protein JTB14_001329 [Gonioctena quinquepunctata]